MSKEMIANFILWGWKILWSVVILVVGFALVKLIQKLVKRLFDRKNFDPTAASFITNIVVFFLKFFVIVAAISQLGVNTVSLSAALGGIAVGVGLALQGALSNFAGGLLILVFKPFRVGDYIETGQFSGDVEEIQILNTVLRKVPNTQVIVPHSVLTSTPLTNFGQRPMPLQQVLTFYTSLDVKIQEVKDLLLSIFDPEDLLEGYEPQCLLMEETRDTLAFSLRFWVRNEDYWSLGAKYRHRGRQKLTDHHIPVAKTQIQGLSANK